MRKTLHLLALLRGSVSWGTQHLSQPMLRTPECLAIMLQERAGQEMFGRNFGSASRSGLAAIPFVAI
jgi:hypothetical protein